MTLALVVEDSRTQAVDLLILLEASGLKVELARDGRAALERCKSPGVDVVLSDVVMPEMNGYELCKRLKGEPKTSRLPVILLTSLADPMDILRGLECGADNFLTKPYDGEYLVGRVRRLLENRALRSNRDPAVGVDVMLMGKPITVSSDREQILDLLLATFEEVVRARQREYEGKLNEQSLRDSVGLLQATLDALPKQIAIIDRAGRITAINAPFRRFARANGWADAEVLVGANYFELFPQRPGAEQHGEKVREGLRALISGEQASIALEYSVASAGEPRFFALSMMPFQSQSSQLVAIELEDISQRKELERQILQSQKMETVGQLAGGVAHDFNNLLTVIRSYGELVMRESSPNEQTRADLEEIMKATDSAGALTSQLLAFGRREVLKIEVLELNAVVSELERMLSRLIGEDIEFRLQLELKGPRVEADSGQLQQILMNLVVNARDAMPDGGTLTITTSSVVIDRPLPSLDGLSLGKYAVIEVSDTGCGMSAELQARIFEPFFTTKEVGKGTGLGLSTVYGIVHQCRGRIWVHSDPGRGTCFEVYIPSVDGVLSSRPPPELAPGLGNETVLIVEDNAQLRAVVVRMLEQTGYRVLSASSAAHARRISEGELATIHLLLTDVVMPGLSGPELARELSQQRPSLRVLFMSGYADAARPRLKFPGEGAAVLQKPFYSSVLRRAVRAALTG
jgi:PAS domain S-box-containing protein